MTDPNPDRLLERVEQDIGNGQKWRARNRLRQYVSQLPFDPRYARRLGELELEFGPGPEAGRYLWLGDSKNPEHADAIQSFLGNFAGAKQRLLLWRQLPKRLRQKNAVLPDSVRRALAEADLDPEKMRRAEHRHVHGSTGDTILAILFTSAVVFGIVAIGVLGCMKAYELIFG